MKQRLNEKKKKAKEMLIDGETNREIKSQTGLRPKTLGKIQKEITKHF